MVLQDMVTEMQAFSLPMLISTPVPSNTSGTGTSDQDFAHKRNTKDDRCHVLCEAAEAASAMVAPLIPTSHD